MYEKLRSLLITYSCFIYFHALLISILKLRKRKVFNTVICWRIPIRTNYFPYYNSIIDVLVGVLLTRKRGLSFKPFSECHKDFVT